MTSPAHWLTSGGVSLDPLQFGLQEAGQQLENKVLLLRTGHVPAHAQGSHVSRPAPVLEAGSSVSLAQALRTEAASARLGSSHQWRKPRDLGSL